MVYIVCSIKRVVQSSPITLAISSNPHHENGSTVLCAMWISLEVWVSIVSLVNVVKTLVDDYCSVGWLVDWLVDKVWWLIG